MTCCSSMASSSALCAFGVARLISSASTSCEKIGPGWNSKRPLSRSKIETPRMSAGSRSLVNWMRWNVEAQRLRERVRERRLADARNVFDEQVAAREQAGEGELQLAALADDDALERIEHGADQASGRRRRGSRSTKV